MTHSSRHKAEASPTFQSATMPVACGGALRTRLHSAAAINTILPLSHLNEAIGHRKTLGQQRSSPLFVAGAFDPLLARCPTHSVRPPRMLRSNKEGVALPPIDVFKNGQCAAVPLHPQGPAAPPNFFASPRRSRSLFVMARLGLAIHEFRWARPRLPQANSWIPRPSRGMTELAKLGVVRAA